MPKKLANKHCLFKNEDCLKQKCEIFNIKTKNCELNNYNYNLFKLKEAIETLTENFDN